MSGLTFTAVGSLSLGRLIATRLQEKANGTVAYVALTDLTGLAEWVETLDPNRSTKAWKLVAEFHWPVEVGRYKLDVIFDTSIRSEAAELITASAAKSVTAESARAVHAQVPATISFFYKQGSGTGRADFFPSTFAGSRLVNNLYYMANPGIPHHRLVSGSKLLYQAVLYISSPNATRVDKHYGVFMLLTLGLLIHEVEALESGWCRLLLDHEHWGRFVMQTNKTEYKAVQEFVQYGGLNPALAEEIARYMEDQQPELIRSRQGIADDMMTAFRFAEEQFKIDHRTGQYDAPARAMRSLAHSSPFYPRARTSHIRF